MGVDILKQKLIERIEQGDEQYIRVMTAVSNALVESAEFDVEAYRASLKPMTVEELIARMKP
jgi:predicted metal-binding transcription factor (methanogenesis marker protein 9)